MCVCVFVCVRVHVCEHDAQSKYLQGFNGTQLLLIKNVWSGGHKDYSKPRWAAEASQTTTLVRGQLWQT